MRSKPLWYARPKDNEGDTTTKEAEGPQNDEPSFKCGKCKNVVEGLIQCESCLSWFCCSCGNYPYEAIAIVTACKALHWYCDPCNDGINPVTTAIGKSIVSCFEKVSDSLLSLVKQQLNVPVSPTATNVMEVEGNDPVSQHHDHNLAPAHNLSFYQVSNIVDEYVDQEKRKIMSLCIIYQKTILSKPRMIWIVLSIMALNWTGSEFPRFIT